MDKVVKLHNDAMRLADQAMLAKVAKDIEKADELTRQAFFLESEAAASCKDAYGLEPTRSILYRSAAALAIDCGVSRAAEQLIATALAGNPPDDMAEELRDLLETVSFHRHLSLRGVKLQSNEFQLSMWGSWVGPGIAPSTEFVGRIQDIEKLIYRTAEKQLQWPFRGRGPIKKDVKKELGVFVSVPRAASFAVSFRLGTQMVFPGMSLADEVIDDIFDCVNLYNESDFEELRKHFPDSDYFENFTGLARNIAPDGIMVENVGFTAVRDGSERQATITTPRKELAIIHYETEPHETVPAKEVVKEPQPRTLTGTVRLADARTQDSMIDIVDANGNEHCIQVPFGLMNDIVRPYFGQSVIVKCLESPQGELTLEAIDPADDTR